MAVVAAGGMQAGCRRRRFLVSCVLTCVEMKAETKGKWIHLRSIRAAANQWSRANAAKLVDGR